MLSFMRIIQKQYMKNNVPLIKEDHPESYIGLPFITLIQMNVQTILTIVDDSNFNIVKCYVLDFCMRTQLSEQWFIELSANWYMNNKDNHPLSIEFAQLGIEDVTNKILHIYDLNFITRVVGPLPTYAMLKTAPHMKNKRKRVN